MLQPSYFHLINQAAIDVPVFLASSVLNETMLGVSPTALGTTEQLPPNLSNNASQNTPGMPWSSDTST